jgi:hypothetical protein
MVGHLLAALVLLAAQSTADFTNAFDGIKSGLGLALTWDAVQPQYYPLCITAQVIDKNGDGFSANAYRVNITGMSPFSCRFLAALAEPGHPSPDTICPYPRELPPEKTSEDLLTRRQPTPAAPRTSGQARRFRSAGCPGDCTSSS